jgi:hypothetical protein
MKMKKTILLAITLSSFIFSGCASLATGTGDNNNDKLKELTAIEMDMDEKDFSISNKKINGVTTYFDVTTKKGKQYHCSVEGGGIIYAGLYQSLSCAKKGEKIPEPLNPLTASQKQNKKVTK